MIWRVPKIWGGCDAWILGGGPSLPRQFGVPSSVIEQVQKGALPPSAYSSYMTEIHNKHVIGVNMSYRIGDWIDIVMFGDSDFFLKEQEYLYKFPGLRVTCNPLQRDEPFVKYLERDTTHYQGITTTPGRVSWNGNTGAAAINLAVHLGAKRIILVGFDMKVEDNMKHWHDLYKVGPVNTERRRMKTMSTFDRHLSFFPSIAADAKRLGITIINANPDSAISCFPKMTVKEILNQ